MKKLIFTSMSMLLLVSGCTTVIVEPAAPATTQSALSSEEKLNQVNQVECEALNAVIKDFYAELMKDDFSLEAALEFAAPFRQHTNQISQSIATYIESEAKSWNALGTGNWTDADQFNFDMAERMWNEIGPKCEESGVPLIAFLH